MREWREADAQGKKKKEEERMKMMMGIRETNNIYQYLSQLESVV
jgi:hypothetical protein